MRMGIITFARGKMFGVGGAGVALGLETYDVTTDWIFP